MDLSIIIVNYNVRYFLEQALVSVFKAVDGIEVEVFVVDNNSVDDSVSMVKAKFPEVILIENNDNPGFSIANNQALKIAKGKYQLLLNPDTVVKEDTFKKCISFFEKTPEAGALGVCMIDGSGKFLPESKRGFPSPSVAFYKISGLSKLFPNSKKYNQYHLGYLDENKTWEVDVLSGAFMMIKKEVLDKIGFLDEQFFMYGEDIDLSYRIKKGGYKNYYFSDTQIIHYKGESTKKGSLNYVKAFYNAMILFAEKHFDKSKAGLFTFLISLAIYFKGGSTLFKNVLKKLFFPLTDAVLIYGGFVLLKGFWANYFYQDPAYFDSSIFSVNFPLYTIVWLSSIFFNGAYDRPLEISRLLRGLFFGLILVAGIYGFLNLEYRSSRAIIILGFLLSLVSTIIFRAIYNYFKNGTIYFGVNDKNRMMLVGSNEECERVIDLLNIAEIEKNIIGRIAPDESSLESNMINHIGKLDEIVNVFKVDELIFCSKDVNMGVIMNWMTKIGPKINYKILPANSLSIIGSNSKNHMGELYTINIQYNIDTPLYRRNKRMLDILTSIAFLFLTPILLWFIEKKKAYIKNLFLVVSGKKTWVGYTDTNIHNNNLPNLREGVLSPASSFVNVNLIPSMVHRLNSLYAKDYGLFSDVEIILKNLPKLGE